MVALAVMGSDLYVGAGFTQTKDGTVANMFAVAKLGITVTIHHSVYLPSVIKQ